MRTTTSLAPEQFSNFVADGDAALLDQDERADHEASPLQPREQMIEQGREPVLDRQRGKAVGGDDRDVATVVSPPPSLRGYRGKGDVRDPGA